MINKSNKSLHTAITAVANTLVGGIVSLVVTRLIIYNYGSNYNGLNATANQLISMLLIVEGGFTLATNVAMFKPLAGGDFEKVNQILSATRVNFIKIGGGVFVLGIVVTAVYSNIIKSPLPKTFIFLVFFMTLISTSFNLIYTMKFQILLQSNQREYIINYSKLLTNVIAQIIVVILISIKSNMLMIRFIIMCFAVINGVIISLIAKNKFKHVDYNAKPDFYSIKGTRDIFIQKMTAMIYGTAPIIFISAFSGTAYASVYAVYNSVFAILKSAIYAFVNAPRMSLGQLISEENKERVSNVFFEYEFIVAYIMLTFLTSTAVLIMPFIKIFTSGVSDIKYNNWGIAIMLVAITFFEIIHIPSGNIINMSGNFKVGRKIQSISSIILVAFIIIGKKFGIIGILAAILITAITLAVLEIVFVHKIYFKKKLFNFLMMLMPVSVLSIIIVFTEIKLLPEILNYFDFFLTGIIVLIINGMLLASFCYMFNKKIFLSVLTRILRLVRLSK